MDLLRFFTAGNVDDGKSTLIGRLLFDSESISTDIIETLTRQSKARGSDSDIDLALLTDGLRAEREQGITIDVAYKYFSTEKRKFIIADTPGHIQYTRNMFTGASNTDLAIILIDARNGVTEQTKRHSIISSVLGIPRILVCINKMDLVNYSEDQYNTIRQEYLDFAAPLNLKHIDFIPVSALSGDNVVNRSLRTPWYSGDPLLSYLENVEVNNNEGSEFSRFRVQYVIRPQTEELHDYRGYAGKVLSGSYKVNEPVVVLPQAIETIIEKIEKDQKTVETADHTDSVVLHLKDDIDISRGDLIVPKDQLPHISNEFVATVCWMDNVSFKKGQKLLIQSGSLRAKALVSEILSVIDIHSLNETEPSEEIKLNELFKARIKVASPFSFDVFENNRGTGAFILINENSNNTVAAGVIKDLA